MGAFFLILLNFGIVIPPATVENAPAMQYIEKYSELAIQEMHRTGIPASIKMAQAMLESNMGRSTLAMKANNHFGMKCGSAWNGQKFYREDDDYQNGKLIKSCFRKYSQGEKSFVAHSDFLSSSTRYSGLFDLNPKDYSAWAYGLKAAGYASDKSYPQKLIQLIEKYELYKLDEGYKSKKQDYAYDEEALKEKGTNKKKASSPTKADGNYVVSSLNKSKVVLSNGKVSMRQIAKDQEMKLKDLKELNQHIGVSTSAPIPAGETIFLEQKKSKYSGKERFHIVEEGESMFSISNKYGIHTDMLYIKNRMPKNAQPMVGEKVHLKGLVRLKDIPKYIESDSGKAKKKRSLF